MAFQFGRLTGLQEPLNWDNSGSRVRLTGSFTGGSVNAALALRNQLLGYHLNSDEPVIPVVSGADSTMNGFYRVLSVDIPTPPVALLSGLFTYQIDLEPVGGYQSTYLESFVTGALMTNALGITTTAEPFHAYPLAAYEYSNNAANGFTTETRPVADGTTTVNWVRMNPTASPIYKALARWAEPAANFYDAACSITNNSPVVHTVVGRQDAPPSGAWVLSNGLVQATLAHSSAYFQGTWADGTHAYRTVGSYAIFGSTSGLLGGGAALGGIRIMRNSPEECIIRCPMTPAAGTNLVYVDVGLRRGSRVIRLYLSATKSETWRANSWTAQACTAITGGHVVTANDGFGNRVLIVSAQASTQDLANDVLTANASLLTFDVGISQELGGTGSVNRDTALSQALQYLGGAGGSQAERMQVAGR